MSKKHIYMAFLYRVAFLVCMLDTTFSHALKKCSVNFGLVVLNFMALLQKRIHKVAVLPV